MEQVTDGCDQFLTSTDLLRSRILLRHNNYHHQALDLILLLLDVS